MAAPDAKACEGRRPVLHLPRSAVSRSRRSSEYGGSATTRQPLGPSGARLAKIRTSTLATYTGDDAKMTINVDIRGPRAWPPECTSIIIVNATVQGTQISPNTFAAAVFDVTLQDGGRYRRALDATRAVIMNAAKSRQEGQAGDVNERPGPKL